nr:hypothetical protein [Tanacetum cinerariifolium]
MNNTSGTSVTPHVDKPKLIAVTPYFKKLHASIPSHSVPQPREFNVVKHRLVHTARTRRPQPKGNTRNARVYSASKSSEVKKNQCLVTANHDACLLSSVNAIEFSCKKPVCYCPLVKIKRDIEHRLFQAYDREHQASHQLCVEFLGTVHFGNDHIAAILGYCDLKWGILQSPGRNTCFIRDLDDVDLLKGNLSTNLYTINLYDMASASPICLMARATPTKSWLWHQRLSHLNFDTNNDLAKNDLVSGLPKFKYAKEHLCPSCEQGKSKRAP